MPAECRWMDKGRVYSILRLRKTEALPAWRGNTAKKLVRPIRSERDYRSAALAVKLREQAEKESTAERRWSDDPSA